MTTKKCFLLIFSLQSVGLSFSQVGINTQNPQATLDIISGGNTASTKALSVKNNLGADVFTIQDNGYTGLGVSNPSVLLDLRGGQNNSIIGIGNSLQVPLEVGAGALRYNKTDRTLDFSEGIEWKRLSANYEKVRVVAQAITVQTFSQNRTATIINWTKLSDVSNRLNATTGIFTAPHDGSFTISVSVNLQNTSSTANNFNAHIALSLIASSGETIKSLANYSTGGNTLIQSPSINCSGTFHLTAGQSLKADLYNYLGSNATLSKSNLFIIEN